MADVQTTEIITQYQQVAFIAAATCEVFSTMLGQEVTPVGAFVERTATAPASGIVSLVGLAGNWVGTGGISCSASFACKISSLFLMAEYGQPCVDRGALRLRNRPSQRATVPDAQPRQQPDDASQLSGSAPVNRLRITT